MVSIQEQVNSGSLVCPKSRQPLIYVNDKELKTKDGVYTYPLINNVPILLDEEQQQTYLSEEGGSMEQIYANFGGTKKASFRDTALYRLDKFAMRNGDYRSQASSDAFQSIVQQQQEDDIFLSIGGGPLRIHPKLVNLNISLFQNVDVVGDAYELPYVDNAVSAIYCEAVLEHLEFPNEAVEEMYRVLKPGGQLFAATPFLQAFHAFPNHFQNFTLIGHQRLFERAKFGIVSSGVCVGPSYTIVDLTALYCMYLPTRILSQWVPRVIRIIGSLFRRADLRLNNRNPSAHIMGSTTYVHAIKPDETIS